MEIELSSWKYENIFGLQKFNISLGESKKVYPSVVISHLFWIELFYFKIMWTWNSIINEKQNIFVRTFLFSNIYEPRTTQRLGWWIRKYLFRWVNSYLDVLIRHKRITSSIVRAANDFLNAFVKRLILFNFSRGPRSRSTRLVHGEYCFR